MSLYDDSISERATEKVAEWSSGIKLIQSQLQLFKTVKKADQAKKVPSVHSADPKLRKFEEEFLTKPAPTSQNLKPTTVSNLAVHNDWSFPDEYDPLRPNEYEIALKELRDLRDREDREKRRKRKSRFAPEDGSVDDEYDRGGSKSCKSSRTSTLDSPKLDTNPSHLPSLLTLNTQAPPPPPPPPPVQISAIAAKIMAKYGFKEGQGLGKQEQGIATALQVERTSKKCGRIVQPGLEPPPPPPPQPSTTIVTKPETNTTVNDVNITEIMKKPSKVIMLRNMVGPGEVDSELEPEVREECNSKYGDVVNVVIREIPDVVAEEAVRIFVEFKRIESAIKAVVDLNGRFFGGRTVKAIFYDWETFNSGNMMDGYKF